MLILDFLSLDSLLSARNFARAGLASVTCKGGRFGFAVLALDLVYLGSSTFAQSLACCALAVLASDFVSL
eukprot:4464033-Amphidinium_carterae.1